MLSGKVVFSGGRDPLYPVGTGTPPLPLVTVNALFITVYSGSNAYLLVSNGNGAGTPAGGVALPNGVLIPFYKPNGEIDLSQLLVSGNAGDNLQWVAF